MKAVLGCVVVIAVVALIAGMAFAASGNGGQARPSEPMQVICKVKRAPAQANPTVQSVVDLCTG